MILIGQYDSPFVRRVGIALTLYGLRFEHRPWSVFADAEAIRAHNPLTRVPVLVLAAGESLIDSAVILDYLDGLVPQALALFPRSEPARRREYRIAALACGLGDKAVSLFYEVRLHDQPSRILVDRCRTQILGTLTGLEASAQDLKSAYWHGDRPGHADIAVACVWHFLRAAHTGLIEADAYPALADLSNRLEKTPAFCAISQPFVAPA